MRSWHWLLLGALLVPSAAGAAQSLGVLAVAPPPGPGPELVDLTSQLRAALAARSPGEVLDARVLRERMSGGSSVASLTDLDRAYEGARTAAVNGDDEGSARTLRAIIDEIERLPDGAEPFRHWSRAMLRLAKTESDLGHGDTARGVLHRLVVAAPDIAVDRALFPPRFVAQVEEVKAQLQALTRRRLTVTCPSPGARVFVNGRDVGPAPATVRLPRGLHRVSAAAGALRAPPLSVSLADQDVAVTVDFAVPDSLRPARGPGLALADGDRERGIIAAGAFLGLDAVLASAVRVEHGDAYLVGSLHDVRRGVLRREGRVRLTAQGLLSPDAAVALAAFLATGEQTSLVEAGRASEPAATAAPASAPASAFAPRPEAPGGSGALGWTAVGAGGAAVGLGALALWQGLSSRSSYDRAARMLGPGQAQPMDLDLAAYGARVRDGDSARRLAIGFGAGAGVCALTSGLLGYLAYRQTGEIGPFRF